MGQEVVKAVIAASAQPSSDNSSSQYANKTGGQNSNNPSGLEVDTKMTQTPQPAVGNGNGGGNGGGSRRH